MRLPPLGKANVFSLTWQAYVLAAPVQIDPAFKYKIEGKERTRAVMKKAIVNLKSFNFSWPPLPDVNAAIHRRKFGFHSGDDQ